MVTKKWIIWRNNFYCIFFVSQTEMQSLHENSCKTWGCCAYLWSCGCKLPLTKNYTRDLYLKLHLHTKYSLSIVPKNIRHKRILESLLYNSNVRLHDRYLYLDAFTCSSWVTEFSLWVVFYNGGFSQLIELLVYHWAHPWGKSVWYAQYLVCISNLIERQLLINVNHKPYG